MNNSSFQKNTTILEDSEFHSAMTKKVEPFLAGICQSGYLDVPEGKLYYEAYCPKEEKGAIVISHGFSESIEKYKEVIYYFVSAGYRVYLADHRGHGRSLRDTRHPHMVHVRQFTDYVDNLHTFVQKAVMPFCNGLPLYLYAHSMGGCIGALYLETYPATFQKAVLTAPMLGIILSVPAPCALALGRILTVLRKDDGYAFGQGAYCPDERFEDSCSTSLPRYQYYQKKRAANPLFQTSGASYGWSYQALIACRSATQKRNCAKITAPVLIFQSPDDHLVKASSIRRFAAQTPSARLIQIEGSRHEIYNSPSHVLTGYYQALFRFLQDN